MTEIDKAEFFERAADVIRTHGHIKGALWEGNGGAVYWDTKTGMPFGWKEGPVCAWGAMYVAGGQMLDKQEENKSNRVNALGWLLERRIPDSIPVWNDAVERTADEVVDKMLELAKDLRNGEAT